MVFRVKQNIQVCEYSLPTGRQVCIFSIVKLTAKVRLLPTDEQAELLLDTLQEANAACNEISRWAFETKTFRQFAIHKGCYHRIKGSFNLSAQVVVRCISKVADSYKLDKKTQRTYRKYGATAYDSRILRYLFEKQPLGGPIVSIWTTGSRQKISYVTGKHHAKLLQYQQGESDLAYTGGKFYLLATVDIPDTEEESFDDMLGADLGIRNILTDSDGEIYEGKELNALRKKREKTRASLQSKGTKGAKKVLKRISGRERTTTKVTNHTIAKSLVAKAKCERKAIALESLEGIRQRTNKRLRKSQKGLHNRWSFYQLRSFIEYKAKREGVAVHLVPPAYTSKTCQRCKHIGKRSGEVFNCTNCGEFHADHNAARNIRSWGRTVALPEESTLVCDFSHIACA